MTLASKYVVFVKSVLFATTLLCCQHTTRASDDVPALDSSYKRLLDVWLAARVEALNIPGLAVAVIHDQDVIYRGCFGYSDIPARTRVTPKTVFRIASQSKLFTALAIMQLRDEGRLNLDDPVEKHLDWVHVKNADGKDARITIRQLLTHTSGLSSIALHSTPLWSDFQFPTICELRTEMDDQVLLFSPGEKLKYSNLGFTLLGQVVESASGQSFADYVGQRLIKPLGLESTTVSIPAESEMLATGYAPRRNGRFAKLPFVDARVMGSATGLSSSIDDLARFVSWQFRQLNSDDQSVVAASTLREMQRPHRTSPEWDFGHGFGFWTAPGEKRMLVGHEGQYPGFFSTTMISPKEKVGVVLLSNGMEMSVYSGKPNSLMDAIFNTIATALEDDDDAQQPVNPDWRQFYGEYRSIWGTLQVMPLRGQLVAFGLNGAEPFSQLFRLKAVKPGSNRFRAVESLDHFYLREEFAFQDFQDGRAMILRDPGAIFKRVTNAKTPARVDAK